MTASRPTPAAPPPGDARLAVRAVPHAPRSEIAGWMGEVLKVKLKAPPVEGKANAELCRFLAEILALTRSQVEIRGGEKSRTKSVAIHGLGLPDVLIRLRRATPLLVSPRKDQPRSDAMKAPDQTNGGHREPGRQ
jgi:uncharacterized protein